MNVTSKLNELIDSTASAFPEGVVAHLRSLVNAGELGLALEELCAYIGEADYTLSLSHWKLIEQMGSTLGVDSSWWNALPHA